MQVQQQQQQQPHDAASLHANVAVFENKKNFSSKVAITIRDTPTGKDNLISHLAS